MSDYEIIMIVIGVSGLLISLSGLVIALLGFLDKSNKKQK